MSVVPIRTNTELEVRDVRRDGDDSTGRSVLVFFSRRLTDDELCFFQEVCERSALLFPED